MPVALRRPTKAIRRQHAELECAMRHVDGHDHGSSEPKASATDDPQIIPSAPWAMREAAGAID